MFPYIYYPQHDAAEDKPCKGGSKEDHRSQGQRPGRKILSNEMNHVCHLSQPKYYRVEADTWLWKTLSLCTEAAVTRCIVT